MKSVAATLNLDAGRFSWGAFVGVGLLSALISLASPNQGPFLLGMAVLILGLRFFYSRNVPPILLACFMVQWLFFQAQLIDGLYRGIDLRELEYKSSTKPVVSMLGMVAVFLYFFGVYIVTRRAVKYDFRSWVSFLNRLDLERLFMLYGAAYLILLFLGGLIWLIPAIAQPMYVLTEFRWALFFLLVATCFAQNRLRGLLLVIVVLDVLLSLGSFFASFKDPFIFLFIGFWMFFFRSSLGFRFAGIASIVVIVGLGSVWSSVKEDYRDFLNKGTGSQTVLVSRSEAYDRLLAMVSEVDKDRLSEGFEALVDRLSWIGAFDAVYNYVPARRPHEDGKLWVNGIERAVMPRAFFPDKAVLEDSKELNYYSGLGVDEKDSSISLSAVAASYVDFGPIGMHIPIFLFGILSGWILRKAFKWGIYPPIGFALAMPVFFIMQISDNSINKLLPHFLLYLLCLWAIKKFVLPYFFAFVITTPRVAPR